MTTAYSSRHSSRDDDKAKAKAEVKPAAAKTRAAVPTMPADGSIIAAGDGYTVLTATKAEDGILRFPPALVVIAWSIGADGAAFPVTAYPISQDTIDVGTVHSNGAVVDLEGNVYPGSLEWQAAVQAREAAADAPTAPPVNVDRPYAGQTGQTLNCTMGNWENMQAEPHSYAYQWRRGGTDLVGATAADYAVTPADVGTTMSCDLTATNALGSATVTSNDVTVE